MEQVPAPPPTAEERGAIEESRLVEQLEAEAERQSRVKLAEGAAQARQIEAEGEAKARQKLADAEAYRIAEIGKVNAVQMEREGRLITKHPLLVQKTLADKLSDKVRVIVAPPGIAGSLMGGPLDTPPAPAAGAQTTSEE
jgi:regulator of protease activity HflC (stomatin/prohibitin superfamily)